MKSYSIALFGSAVRSDFDEYSDKDLLLVAQEYNQLQSLKQTYEKKGFSVSAYTFKRLQSISQRGSLFILHIKQEAEIIQDENGFLRKILEEHSSCIPTTDRIIEAKSYFDYLKVIPLTTNGFSWFCDCFYVGFRNYLILLSALHNKYTFSYLQLLSQFEAEGLLTKEDYAVLRELRIIKRNYRAKIKDELPDKSYIENIASIAQKIKLIDTFCFAEMDEFNEFARKKLVENIHHYHKLRLIEILHQESGVSNDRIEKMVCNPQHYAITLKNRKTVDKLLSELDCAMPKHLATSVFETTTA